MFTGIIKELGTIEKIEKHGDNFSFHISSVLGKELKVDESVCHNGICLTIEQIQNNTHRVTAVRETLIKTNSGEWKVGDAINLERAIRYSDRLDGHIVQGHVDGTAKCIEINDRDGSKEFTFQFDSQFAPLIIEKGSICLNGVSLTLFDVKKDQFTVTIIPYTFSHTNFKNLAVGDKVNVEFDVIGKYILRYQDLKSN